MKQKKLLVAIAKRHYCNNKNKNAMRDATSKKNTNATKKYCLLKQQNKPTATELTETLAIVASLRSRSRRERGGG